MASQPAVLASQAQKLFCPKCFGDHVSLNRDGLFCSDCGSLHYIEPVDRQFSGDTVTGLIEMVDGVTARLRIERIAEAICQNRDSHRLEWDGNACGECVELAVKVHQAIEFPGVSHRASVTAEASAGLDSSSLADVRNGLPGPAGLGDGEGATECSGEPSPDNSGGQ